MPGLPLPRSTPSDQGVDRAGIDAFLAALAPVPDVELHSLMVLRHGHVVAERWWAPYGPDRPHLLYSLSKSFTATALGFAVAEGLVDLDATVLSYFCEFEAEVTDPRSRAMTVRHIAAMASGHADETVERAWAVGRGDLVRGMLLIPPDHEPGTFFAYNQPCTYALSRIINRVTGGTMTEFLRPRLYEPLGIRTYGWVRDQHGRELGFSGLHTTTEAVAKLGQLHLDGGRWEGRQLLPEWWVAEATRSHVVPVRDNVDWRQGYGFQFWMSRHGYRGDGAYGQFMVVLPEADAVAAMTAQSPDMQTVLDALWEHLLPALTRDGGPVGRWPAETPSLAGPSGASMIEGTFRAAPGTTAVTSAELRGGELTLTDDGPPLTVTLGDAWTPTGAVAAGASTVDGRLHVDLIFAETPHRMHLVLDPATAEIGATWQTEPLAGRSLAETRSPTAPD